MRTILLLLACASVACSAPAERSVPSAEAVPEAASPNPAEELPRFEAFPADSLFTDKPAPVDLSSNPEAPWYRTVLRTGAAEGPNFAGHLTVVSWGCGTGCQVNAVVDARTGYVYPQTLVTKQGVEHRLESRLLIADPYDPELAPEDCPSCVTTAGYVWRSGRFEPVGEGPHPHLSTLQ